MSGSSQWVADSMTHPSPGLDRQRVPNADGQVARAGDQSRAVRAPGDGVYVVGVAAELGDFLAARHVDQAQRVIVATDSQSRAVGAEGDPIDFGAEWESGNGACPRLSQRRTVESSELDAISLPSKL